MLRARIVAIALLSCSLPTLAHSQTPRGRSGSFGTSAQHCPGMLWRASGEMFGLNGPAAFLTSYGRFIDDGQPLTAALTFTTKTPMFAAEFVIKDSAAFFAATSQDGTQFDSVKGELTKAGSSLRFFVQQSGNKIRLSDNAEFLRNVPWSTPEQFSRAGTVAVIARIDWRGTYNPNYATL